MKCERHNCHLNREFYISTCRCAYLPVCINLNLFFSRVFANSKKNTYVGDKHIFHSITLILTDMEEPRNRDESMLIHFSQIVRQSIFYMF